MEKLYSLIETYLHSGMDHSALVLSEYVYRREGTETALVLLFKSMYRLRYYERCVEMVEGEGSMAEIHDVRIIYYKCKSLVERRTKNIAVSTESRRVAGHPLFPIRQKSIELLFNGLTKEDIRRKEMLLEAYACDHHNLEALLRMRSEDLGSKREVLRLVEGCEDEQMREVYMEIFCPGLETGLYLPSFYSPWYGLVLGKQYYRDKKSLPLFNLGVCMFRLYPSSELSFVTLGLFFLLSSNYTEARRCFYKAVQINSRYGRGWLYLGIAYSGMKECESSVSCLNMAHKLMVGSFKPSFYLAVEYHRMNNFERASFFYKQALKMDPSILVQERYISLLIYYEYYTEALSYLAAQKNSLLGLLRVYCHLFLGKVSEAQKHLSACPTDWRYYATAGFIDHLMNRLDSAADNYNKALLKTHVNLVEELLGLAVENMARKQSNNVYDYATDLFDTMTQKYSFDIV